VKYYCESVKGDRHTHRSRDKRLKARCETQGPDAAAAASTLAPQSLTQQTTPNQRIAAHRTNIRDMMHLPATTTLLRR
jgi:hypothetical protein